MKKNSKRRRFGRYPVFVAGALVSAGLLLEPSIFPSKTPKLEQRGVSFLDVKNNSRLRQSYLDQIVNEHGLVEGLKGVNYEPGLIGIHKADSMFVVMRTTYPEVPAGYKGNDLETEIVVYGGAFNSTQSEDEFLNLLINHEYRHTDQMRGRMKLNFSSKQEYDSLASEIGRRFFDINGDLYELVREIDAYRAQIDSFGKKNLSEKFKRDIISLYNFHVDLLGEKAETPFVKYLKGTWGKL
jgi:hypothetical protein